MVLGLIVIHFVCLGWRFLQFLGHWFCLHSSTDAIVPACPAFVFQHPETKLSKACFTLWPWGLLAHCQDKSMHNLDGLVVNGNTAATLGTQR